MKILKYLIAITLILPASLVSCVDSNLNRPPHLTIYLEDSPGEFNKVTIKLEKLEILKDGAWEEMALQKSQIIISELVGGKYVTLSDKDLDESTYSRLRITFASTGNQITSSQETTELTISDSDRFVELPIDVETKPDGTYLMCDLDLYASIDTTNFILKPQMSVVDMHKYGVIRGVVADSTGTENSTTVVMKEVTELLLVQIEDQSHNVIKSTYTYNNRIGYLDTPDGTFFARVPAGEYTVAIRPRNSSTFNPTFVTQVVVEEAKSTDVGLIPLTLKEPKQ